MTVLVLDARPSSASTKVDVHLDRLQLGSLTLRDVTIQVRDQESCVTARIGVARVTGCGTLRTVDGDVRIERGHAELSVPAQSWDGGKLGQTKIVTEVSGSLSNLDLELRGTARTMSAELGSTAATASLRDLELPFSVRIAMTRGGLHVREHAPLAVRVGGASVRAFGTDIPIRPSIALHPGWPTWRADVAWTGVELGTVVAALSGGRVEASGRLDGQLIIERDAKGAIAVRGTATSRSGDLRVGDGEWRDRLVPPDASLAIHRRVAATLADFSYSRFDAVLGGEPTLRINLVGRGKRVPQDVDLVVNVRSQR